MTPITLPSYGPGSPPKTVIAERITHWEPISFAGESGVRIYMDGGVILLVAGSPQDIEHAIRRAGANPPLTDRRC